MPHAKNPQFGVGTVLLLESDFDAAEPLSALFQLDGFRVLSRSDGASGVVAALEHGPDFTVMSLSLFGLDGCDVARALRSLPKFRSTPIVALTGHSDPENRLRAIEAGFDAYFCKPVNFTALRDRLVETRAGH